MRWTTLILVMLLGCQRAPVATPVRPSTPSAQGSGMWWGRWQETPEGAWITVWMQVTDGAVRGSYDLPPWHGEVVGVVEPDGRWRTVWHEEGTVAVGQVRSRRVTLQWDAARGARVGDGVTLRPGRPQTPGLRPGAWLARWTGLPPGMVVETLVTRETRPEGVTGWRAVYQYQGRAGRFEGTPAPGGALSIEWQESSGRDAVSRGGGLLLPDDLGLRGEYGMGDATQGVGVWRLEPAPW